MQQRAVRRWVGWLVLVYTALAQAQAPTPPPTTPPAGKPKEGAPATPPAGQGAQPTAPAKPQNIDETTKEFEKLSGLLTCYRKMEKGKLRFLVELPENWLGRLFLIQATFSSGSAGRAIAGVPIRDLVVKFERLPDERVVLVLPNLNYRAKPGSPLATAMSRDFPPAFLEVFTPVAKQDDRKSLLLELSDFFRGGFTGFTGTLDNSELPEAYRPFFDAYVPDPNLIFIAATKVFPRNLVVETQYHFRRAAKASRSLSSLRDMTADARSLPVRVLYNLLPLPAEGYQPRLADQRVGYFTSGQLNSGHSGFESFDDESRRDPRVIYILRWRLEKADPAAAVSKPKQPIVFWLDKAIPTEHREAVRQGVLMWNQPLERCGFQDAIVVKQMPDDADWDHADLRYNVVRWVASPPSDGNAYAVALFRENPLTGEIINAGINVNANFARLARLTSREVINAAGSGAAGEPRPALPAWHPAACAYAAGLAEQARVAWLAIQALPAAEARIAEQDYVKQMLRETVAHEMGHILGLRHNFAASCHLDAKQLADARTVAAQGTSASVMDYVPFNLYALKQREVEYFGSAVGVYDQWAIEYGYRPVSANTPEEELPALRGIAARCNEPGLAYHGDELADGYDPHVVRFDLGRDPLAYAESYLKLLRDLTQTLGRRLPGRGEDYSEFTEALYRLIWAQRQCASMAVRYVGGLNINRNLRGDPGEQPQLRPVAVAEQRRALRLLTTAILADDAIPVPAAYLTQLAGDQFDMDDAEGRRAFPLLRLVSAVQQQTLSELLAPARLERLVHSEYKVARRQDAMTLWELCAAVREAVWGSLGGQCPSNYLSRELQRAHLELLTASVVGSGRGEPADARMLAGRELKWLAEQLPPAAAAATDGMTRAHYQDCQEKVKRALETRWVVAR